MRNNSATYEGVSDATTLLLGKAEALTIENTELKHRVATLENRVETLESRVAAQDTTQKRTNIALFCLGGVTILGLIGTN